MVLDPQREAQAAQWLRDLFDRDITRLSLSGLIILSVLPFAWVEHLHMVFFGIFAVELMLRYLVLRHDLRSRALSRSELLFFALDILATLSFLPLDFLLIDMRYLRLMRLSRMILLIGYWAPVVKEIAFILAKRERRYQIVFVLVASLILALISAVLLAHFHTQGLDLNEDGNPRNDHSFWSLLWWSFRQIQDPGNMLKDATASLAFLFSVLLTTAGLFIFSFLVGIGTSVVEELVAIGKERRLGMRRHSVICNVGSYSQVLIEELCTYYAKSFRSPRIVAMGTRPTRYPYMLEGRSQSIRYRQGQPISVHDLKRVDADRATRVLLLGQGDRLASDSEVISQILSVREVNPSCDIHAELYRPENIRAALTAGGGRTVPILADNLVGLFLANIAVLPGVQDVYWELLTSKGDEIYTGLFQQGALASQPPPSGPLPEFAELLDRCHQAFGVILLGHLVKEERSALGFVHALSPGSPRADAPSPPSVPPVDSLAGFFGVADNFQQIKSFIHSLPDVHIGPPPDPLPEEPILGTCPRDPTIARVLLCGFHDGLVDFCKQLVLFCGRPELAILVSDEARLKEARRALLRRFDDPALLPRFYAKSVNFEDDGPRRLKYTVEDDDREPGTVHLLVGDWTDDDDLLQPPGLGRSLAELDLVFFTYAPGEPDPDARTALGLIKLIHLHKTRPDRVRSGQRVVCEVQSSEKARLFRRRFCDESVMQHPGCLPVAVVGAERLRNCILAQAVFVPGISGIYRELLSSEGQGIVKLLVGPVREPEAVWTFGQLLSQLYRRHGLICLGIELEDNETRERRISVNPRPRDLDYRFRAGQLVSLFAVGDRNRFPRSDRPCDRCPTEPGRSLYSDSIE